MNDETLNSKHGRSAERQTRSGRRPVKVRQPWVIETPRLRVRPMQPADREDFISMLRESRAALDEFLSLHEPGETDDSVFDRHLALGRASLRCPDVAMRRVIECDGNVIGIVYLNDMQPGACRSAELVAWITTSVSGRGYGSEAIDAVAVEALAPNGLGLHVLYALAAPTNHTAIRSLERAGFVEVSGVPLVELSIGGQWRPHAVLTRCAAVAVDRERSGKAHEADYDSTTVGENATRVVVRRLMSSSLGAR